MDAYYVVANILYVFYNGLITMERDLVHEERVVKGKLVFKSFEVFETFRNP